jgi:hypothetical protein
LVAYLANTLFTVKLQFKKVLHALGLAYIWRVVAVINIIGAIPFLTCLVTLMGVLAGYA